MTQEQYAKAISISKRHIGCTLSFLSYLSLVYIYWFNRAMNGHFNDIHRVVSSRFIIKFKINPFHYSSNNLCWWNLISSGKCICWWLNQLPNCHQSSRFGCTVMRLRLEAKGWKGGKHLNFGISEYQWLCGSWKTTSRR